MTTRPHRSAVVTAKRDTYKHAFVDTLPEELDEGVLYVSMQYATAAHNCFCGCGREVVTPLHPTKWKMTFDGVNVSLLPSIGSWSLACRSHYWLRDGRVSWADAWSEARIDAVRRNDLADQEKYFEKDEEDVSAPARDTKPEPVSLWRTVAGWLMGE